MREIKFRALLRKDQKIYKVLHLYWVEDHSYISKPTVLLDDNKISYPKYKYDDIVLMQYAGLKDKNGKDIYEGDILRNDGKRIVEVRWFFSSQVNGWDFVYKGGAKRDNIPTRPWSNKVWEVIGNIYENPELL